MANRDHVILRFKILEFVLHFGTAHDFPIAQYLHEFERKNKKIRHLQPH